MVNGIDLRTVSDMDLLILERYHLRERKVQLLTAILGSPSSADPQGALKMLKNELFPEFGEHSKAFVEVAEKVFEEVTEGDSVLRISVDRDGAAQAREQKASEITNIEDIIRANRGRGRR